MFDFKRRLLQPQQQEQKRQIGQPQLLHTTYDQNNLLPQSSGLTASSAPSQYFTTPSVHLPPDSSRYRRFDSSLDSGDVFQPGHSRDNSSVYSRPSHEAGNEALTSNPPPTSSSSPHSSQPVLSATLNHPYTEMPPTSTLDVEGQKTPTRNDPQGKKGYFGSHIPQPKQKSVEKKWTRPTEGTTKWDPFRGEPVKDGRGKEGSIRPNTFERNLGVEQRYEVSISGGAEGKVDKPKKATWGERAARLRRDTLDARPPWRGGSGRSAIVAPVKDTEVPRSSPKFTATREASKATLGGSASDSSMATLKQSDDGIGMSPVSQLGGRYDDERVMMRDNSGSFKGESNVSPITTASASKKFFIQKQLNPPPIKTVAPEAHEVQTPTTNRLSRKPIVLEPQEVDNQPADGTTRDVEYKLTEIKNCDTENKSPQPVTPKDTPQQTQAGGLWSTLTSYAGPAVPPEQDLQSDPVSRFSWTTVNTTTTYQQDSPPPSPPSAPVPILDRQAWGGAGVVPVIPAKPPTPPQHGHDMPPSRKVLPPAPGVSKTMNHVDALAAQETDLVVRRRNIQKIIGDLQQIDTASPLDVDWKTVKANKKNLEEHQMLLSEIEREQHELGLAIARARRKAEREEGLESGLWVRNVTG